jgi:hypothetical protein
MMIWWVTMALAQDVSLPVQGALLGADGAPVHGTHTLHWTLRGGGGGEVASGSAPTAFVAGAFAVLVQVDAADLVGLTDGTLEVAVDDGPTSAPVPLGTAPTAAWAVEAGRLGGLDASEYLTTAYAPSWGALTGDPGDASALGPWADARYAPAGATVSWSDLTGDPGDASALGPWADGRYAPADVSFSWSDLTGDPDDAVALTTWATQFATPGAANEVQLTVDASSTCGAGQRGKLRWTGEVFQGCTTLGWSPLHATGPGTATNPALSCTALKRAYPSAPNGNYWLDVDAGGALPAGQVECDFTTAGGPWTVVHHDSETERQGAAAETQVTLSLTINYNIPTATLSAISAAATGRSQAFTKRCRDSLLSKEYGDGTTSATTGFESLAGSKTTISRAPHLGGATPTCDLNDATLRTDSYTFVDLPALTPVMKIWGGDSGDSGELAYYTIGPARFKF